MAFFGSGIFAFVLTWSEQIYRRIKASYEYLTAYLAPPQYIMFDNHSTVNFFFMNSHLLKKKSNCMYKTEFHISPSVQPCIFAVPKALLFFWKAKCTIHLQSVLVWETCKRSLCTSSFVASILCCTFVSAYLKKAKAWSLLLEETLNFNV